MRRIEDAEQKNEVITPESSDYDEDSPRQNLKIECVEKEEVEEEVEKNKQNAISIIEEFNKKKREGEENINNDTVIIDISSNLS